VEFTFELPLGEIVFDFYDKLKTISKGYASFDYHPMDYRQSKLVKMDILLNGHQVDALSALIHRDNAQNSARRCAPSCANSCRASSSTSHSGRHRCQDHQPRNREGRA
jgi:translation elongation factor EF-4